MTGLSPEAVLARVARRAVLVSAVSTGLALVVGGFSAAVGVVGGSVLALMSFLLLKRGTARLTHSRGARGGMLLIVTRYALLGLAAYVMIARLRLHPIGLLVGASSIAAAVAIEAAVSRHR